MFKQEIWGVDVLQSRIYYMIVLISLLFLLYKYRKSGFLIWIILLFFPGLFAFASKDVLNIYKITMLIQAIYWLYRSKAINDPNLYMVKVAFLIFSLTFIQTSIRNNDYLMIILSQYSRYMILFIIFLILYKLRKKGPFREKLDFVIRDILLIQIVLSAVKLVTIGITESVVGSIAFDGGAFATTLPLLGFIFLWIYRNGKLKTKDWYFTIGLLFIGFMSEKRAIWFIFPIVVALLAFFVSNRKISIRVILLSSLIIPVIIYIGLRLNPTLNPDSELWGKFNLEYALEYAEKYSFGNEDDPGITAVGRGSATLQILNKLLYQDIQQSDWWGNGLRFFYASNYIEFDTYNFGLNHKGSATGIYQTYLTNGIVGLLAYLLLMFSMIFQSRNLRFRIFILTIFLWDYFFYSGHLGREPALSFLLVYTILIPGNYFFKLLSIPVEQEID